MRTPKSKLEEIFDKYNGKSEFSKQLDEFIRSQKEIGKPVHAKKLYHGIEKAIKEVTKLTLACLEKDNGETNEVYEEILECVVDIISAIADFSDQGSSATIPFVTVFLKLVADVRRRLVTRLEAAKFLNSELETFKACGGSLGPLKSLKLLQIYDKLIIEAGDLEFEVCITELIFRLLVSPLSRKTYAVNWFLASSELREEFLKIREGEFESDCRNFLNKVNEKQLENRRVHSLLCKEVYLGTLKVPCATNDGQGGWFWTDFNLGSKTVTFFACDDQNDNWETVAIKAENVIECRFNERTEDREIAMVVTMKEPVASLLSFCPEQEESYVKFIFDEDISPVNAAKLVFSERIAITAKVSVSPDVIASTPPKSSVAITAVHLSSRSKGVAKTVPTVTRPRKKRTKESRGSGSAKSSETDSEKRGNSVDEDTCKPTGPSVEHEGLNGVVNNIVVENPVIGNEVEYDEKTVNRNSRDNEDNKDGQDDRGSKDTRDNEGNTGTNEESKDSGCVDVTGDVDVSGMTGDDGVSEDRMGQAQDMRDIGGDIEKDKVIGELQDVVGLEKEVIGESQNVGVIGVVAESQNIAEPEKEIIEESQDVGVIGVVADSQNIAEPEKEIIEESQDVGVTETDFGPQLQNKDEPDKAIIKEIEESQNILGSLKDNVGELMTIEDGVGNTVDDNRSAPTVTPTEKSGVKRRSKKTAGESDGIEETSSALEDTSTTKRGKTRKTRIPRPKPAPRKGKAKKLVTSTSESELYEPPKSKVKSPQSCYTVEKRTRTCGRKTLTDAQNKIGTGYVTEDWVLGLSDVDRRKQRKIQLEKYEGNPSRTALINKVFRDTTQYTGRKKDEPVGPFELAYTPVVKRNKQGDRVFRSAKRLYDLRKDTKRRKKKPLPKNNRECFSDIATEALERQHKREEAAKANHYSEGDIPSWASIEKEATGSEDAKEYIPTELTTKSTYNNRKVKSKQSEEKQEYVEPFSITEFLMEQQQLDSDAFVFGKDRNDFRGVDVQPFGSPLPEIFDFDSIGSPNADLEIPVNCTESKSQLDLNGETMKSPKKAGGYEEENRINDGSRDNDENLRNRDTERPSRSKVGVKTGASNRGSKRINKDKEDNEDDAEQYEEDKELDGTQVDERENDEEYVRRETRRETQTKVKSGIKNNERLHSPADKAKPSKKISAKKPAARNRIRSPEQSPEYAENGEESDRGSQEAVRRSSRIRKNKTTVREALLEEKDNVEDDDVHLSEDNLDVCESFQRNFARILHGSTPLDLVLTRSSPCSSRTKRTVSSSRVQEKPITPKNTKSTTKAKQSSRSVTKTTASPNDRMKDMVNSDYSDYEEGNDQESPLTKGRPVSPVDQFKFDVRTPKSNEGKDSGFVDNAPSTSSRKRALGTRDHTPGRTSRVRDETPGTNTKKPKRYGSLNVQRGSATPRGGYQSNQETRNRSLLQQESAGSSASPRVSLTQPSTKYDQARTRKRKVWNEEEIGFVSGPFTAYPEHRRQQQVFTSERNKPDDHHDEDVEDEDDMSKFGTPGIGGHSFVPIQPRKLFRSSDWSAQIRKQRTFKQRQEEECHDDDDMEDAVYDIGDEVNLTLTNSEQGETKTIKRRQNNAMANSTRSKIQDIWEKHSAKRDNLVSDYTRHLNKYIQGHQNLTSRNQESEDKLLAQLKKHLETSISQRKEQEKCLQHIINSHVAFTDAFQELEEDSYNQQTGLQNYLRQEMSRYRDQIVKDVQKQEVLKVQRRVKAMLASL